MDFSLSDERRMLKDTAERFLTDCYNISRRHQAVADERGFDPQIWEELADLGLPAALLPPDAGGFGGSGEDITILFEAFGQSLVVEPFLASVMLGAWSLHLAGGQDDLLADVLSGQVQLALAYAEPDGRYDLFHCATTFANGCLTGHKSVVMNAGAADKILVVGRHLGETSDKTGLGLYLIDPKAKGLQLRSYGTIDAGHAADIQLHDCPAICLCEDAADILQQVMANATLALCAEALGAMEYCKNATIDYLKTRKQFGKNLGSFQVLQHRMVDLVIEIEQVRSSIMLAAAHLSQDNLRRDLHVSAAKSLVGRVAKLVSEETIQMHGGIAMCWEYDVAHYAKRLIMIDHQLGDADHHLDRFVALSKQVV
ncbi:MAG: pimeloyl-CoA dehydrogenase small subunit [Alphaproteobacteria bacterium TMED150]|nr:pimeloyl-CoA dehydrogenase small subunit [Paracoccaceae bacterium]RPH14062.1 MAG: pimeloyl-CoA dehydrogenase small subunit [Alphaproteobacteria bacterium TMED150]|tara:strand:+ start:1161 stop:2267 length:1107 start_codon:yes stop_codon:yes gene_type:complete